jgi:hypothetical protein
MINLSIVSSSGGVLQPWQIAKRSNDDGSVSSIDTVMKEARRVN